MDNIDKNIMDQTAHHQRFFIKTYKDDDHFVKRIWNTFARLDMQAYCMLIYVKRLLCFFKWKGIVNDSFNFLYRFVVKTFNLFSTPEFKNFRYDENKNIVKNLYNFARKTIKKVTTVEIPKSRSKGCLVFGFLFCILPEFILRKVVLGPLMIIMFGLLWMTSWVGVFIFIPLFCLLWYIIKFVSKIILVFLTLVTTAVLAICVLLVPAMYFVFMTIFTLTVGIIVFLIYPLLLGLRVVILTVIALVYYIFRALSVIKTCCFVEESVPEEHSVPEEQVC